MTVEDSDGAARQPVVTDQSGDDPAPSLGTHLTCGMALLILDEMNRVLDETTRLLG